MPARSAIGSGRRETRPWAGRCRRAAPRRCRTGTGRHRHGLQIAKSGASGERQRGGKEDGPHGGLPCPGAPALSWCPSRPSGSWDTWKIALSAYLANAGLRSNSWPTTITRPTLSSPSATTAICDGGKGGVGLPCDVPALSGGTELESDVLPVQRVVGSCVPTAAGARPGAGLGRRHIPAPIPLGYGTGEGWRERWAGAARAGHNARALDTVAHQDLIWAARI